jgi:hypothetical protein
MDHNMGASRSKAHIGYLTRVCFALFEDASIAYSRTLRTVSKNAASPLRLRPSSMQLVRYPHHSTDKDGVFLPHTADRARSEDCRRSS